VPSDSGCIRGKTMRSARVRAGEAALQEVDAADHRGEMNAFGSSAALDVGDIGLEHLLE